MENEKLISTQPEKKVGESEEADWNESHLQMGCRRELKFERNFYLFFYFCPIIQL